jgi:hypothetical protein
LLNLSKVESEDMTETGFAKQELPPPPPPLAGIAVAAVVVAAIIGWVALGGLFLSETALFSGFMVLWYWAKVERLAMAQLPHSVLGALVGIGIAWAMFYGAANFGGVGLLAGLALLIVAIYLDIIQTLPLFFNASTMLFSIVAAAPLIQLRIDWIELCLATIGGGIFFGTFVASVMWLAARFGPKPP